MLLNVLQREIFVLNLEDGYFACQVNESTDFLQLFELSRLCDGKPQCFKGSDELHAELKCSDRNQCHPKQPKCSNGVCLDNLCYCNDGFGGKACNLPDENECKYRPCDVFAMCTNTLGSFYCTCMPGYDGDGFTCHDVNECEDPVLSSYCVENSECCNLPGHFVCKCKDGFEGNGTQSCTDVDECLKPDSCGRGALCTNKLGSYECKCPEGFTGDSRSECWDIDECKTNPCGNGTCHNLPGDYSCTCLPGYIENPKPENGCVDINECDSSLYKNPCGPGSICINTDGSFFCQCPRGFTGDPRTGCVDIDECEINSCGANTICVNSVGGYKCECKEGHSGDPYLSGGCLDINECSLDHICAPQNAECINNQGGYECKCRTGYTGNPTRECVDIDECKNNPCGSGAICVNLEGSSPGYQCKCPEKYVARGNPEFGCDKAECETDDNCIGNARCLNSFCYCPPPYLADNDCTCPPNYINDAYVGCLSREETKISYAECTEKVVCPADKVCYRGLCSQKDSCSTNGDCLNDSVCKLVNDNVGKQCVDPCDQVQCGPNSYCATLNHQPACHCNTSYSGNPNDLIFGCSPKGPPSFMVYCDSESDCDQKSVCKPNFAGAKICVDVCDHTQCGPNAFCRGVNKKAECFCANKHFTGNPYDLKQGCTLPASAHLCSNDEDCSIEKSCILTLEGVRNCVDVCKHHQCSEGSKCVVRNHRPLCECLSGFARVSSPGPNGSIQGTCEAHLCESDNECKHDEHCIVNMRGLLDCAPVCAEMICGENADCISVAHQASCICKSGYEGNAMDLIKGCQPTAYPTCEGCKAREPRICVSNPDCGDAQECVNGQCRFLCIKDGECIVGERCLDGFCVPIGMRNAINLPPRDQYDGSDKDQDDYRDKYVTPSTVQPSTGSDQKIIQPDLKPSSFPHLKTDVSYKKPSGGQIPIRNDQDFNQLPKIEQPVDRNRQPDINRPDLSRHDLNRPDLSRPDLTRPDSGRPDLSRPDSGRPDLTRPDSGRPDLTRPDLTRPDLTRPDSGRPDSGRPDLSRPDLSKPSDVFTKPKDVLQPPLTIDDINRIKNQQPGIKQPDSTGPVYEGELHEGDNDKDRDRLPPANVDEKNKVKQPAFGDRTSEYRPDYKHPIIDHKTDHRTSTDTRPDTGSTFVDHDKEQDIYNPPEYKSKPDKTQEGVFGTRTDFSKPDLSRPDLSRPDLSRPDSGRPDLTRPDSGRPDLTRPDLSRPDLTRPDLNRPDLSRPDLNRPDLSRPDLSRPDSKQQIGSVDQMMPEYKHPLTKDDDLDQMTPVIHRKQPTINDRRPMPSMDHINEPDFPSVTDNKRPTRPNLTITDPHDSYHPDRQKPVQPDFSRPDLSRPDLSRPDSTRPDITMPDLGRPDIGRPDLSKPDFDKPDFDKPDFDKPGSNIRPDMNRPDSGRPDLSRPDLLHPNYSKPKVPYITHTTESPFVDVMHPFKDEKKTIRPEITLPDNKPYIPPVIRTTDSPIDSKIYSTRPSTSTSGDKHIGPAVEDQGGDEYNPPEYPPSVSSRIPTIDTLPHKTDKPDLIPFKEQKDNAFKPQTKTDNYQPPAIRPDLKWPTRTDQQPKKPTKVNQTVTNERDGYRPFEPIYTEHPESRLPITTPESTKVESTKPSRTTDVSRPQTKYPVSTRPDITRPETYTRTPVESTSVSTSTSTTRKGDKQTTRQPSRPSTSRPTTSRPTTSKPIDSSRPHQQDYTTRQPITFTSSPIDKKQQQKPTSKPGQNTFTEVKPSDQYTKVDTEIRHPDKDKSGQPPVLDHSKPEVREPYDNDYRTNYKVHTSTPSSRSNVTTSKQPVTSRPDTRKPSSERPDIRKPSIDQTTGRPSGIRPTSDKTTDKPDDKTKPQQPIYIEHTTSKPGIQKTTIPDQSRITEVKHASMQDFTSRQPNIKTQTSPPTIDYRPVQTQPSHNKPRPTDVNTPSSVSSTSSRDSQPTGERCTNNYCVPYFDEGMLKVPVGNKTTVQPSYTGEKPYSSGRPIATVTTTEESIHGGPYKPSNKSPTIDHPMTIEPDKSINIQICVDGICRDKIMTCHEDNDCPSDRTCDLESKQCISPCYACGANSECSAVDHRAVCICPKNTVGDAFDKDVGCFPPETTDPSTERTIPPVSHINVLCQSDGIQVGVKLGGYDGIVYVKGYSQEYECRRSVRSDERDVIDFKVMFGQCGLFHSNGEASFILVVQKHPKLVTYRARAYHIKCMYNTGERVVTLGFNVSMITTSGTIANTGPPPTCTLSICTLDGNEVSSAEIGDDLLLKVNVQPDFIYGGFARSCIAKTMEEEGEFQYEVTDANGCATDQSIFGNWEYDESKKSLVARFNAFKFPSSNNLRFQCNIRICFNNCPTANCEETEAYGRRRRRELEASDESDQTMTLANSLGIDTYKEGQLREEIQVQSNAILTFEKREQPSEPYGQQRSEEELDHVCLPKLGLVLSMIITTLLAIVAVAVAISCWLMAYRRKVNHRERPFSHPSEIPNPLFTPEPNLPIEPIPDYYT